MGLVREETFADAIELSAYGSLSDLDSLFERSIRLIAHAQRSLCL
ncbi:hypothetical protein [Bradyrhizobium japonicum]|nr:hypothetical protein [Bradyrhizobium japonicum]